MNKYKCEKSGKGHQNEIFIGFGSLFQRSIWVCDKILHGTHIIWVFQFNVIFIVFFSKDYGQFMAIPSRVLSGDFMNQLTNEAGLQIETLAVIGYKD